MKKLILNDIYWMKLAIKIAKYGMFTTKPNPAVGCVIVKNNTLLGKGWHTQYGKDHAEIMAINSVKNKDQLRGATAYITLEPCNHFGKTAPCSEALLNFGISRVVIGAKDPHETKNESGISKLIKSGIEVIIGVCKPESENINIGYNYSYNYHKPYVRCKLAMSLDGKTSMISGKSKWISNISSRKDVQYLRARSGAIITGINTIIFDNPTLGIREEKLLKKYDRKILQPIYVILDRKGRLPHNAKIIKYNKKYNTILWHVVEKETINTKKLGIQTIQYKKEDNLSWILNQLYQNNIHDVLIESGPTLSGQAISQGLINELWIYIAPKLMGNWTNPLLILPEIKNMDDIIHLKLIHAKKIKEDLRLIYKIKKK